MSTANCFEAQERLSRRDAIVAILSSVAGLPIQAFGQQPQRVAVIGRLASNAAANASVEEALRRGLRDLKYVEGRDFIIEHRTARGQVDKLPSLAEGLVRLKVDVIVTATDETTLAAKHATSTIPIVTILYNSPMSIGLAESLNQPRGNVTGIYARQTELAGKRLELLKEVVAHLSRVGVLYDAFSSQEVEELKVAARLLQIQAQFYEMKTDSDLEVVFRNARKQKATAIIATSSPGIYVAARRIGSLALEYGIPTTSPYRDITQFGGLMSYGGDVLDGFYRAAYFIDRILKGAKPEDLAFEQLNVKLVFNARAAQMLGITIPESILLRADEVIR